VIGLALTLLVTLILRLGFGPGALLPALSFGAIATAIQAAAGRVVRGRAGSGSFESLVRGWAVGFGLRLLGVALMTAAIVARRDLFPPLPTAFGFLGVTIPLLFMEIRLAR
jgi:hypothetical protein